MDASVTTQTHAPDARAEALVASYERAGYVRVAPPILQPAEPFLDLSGEDIRRRMYPDHRAGRRELCLRPDLTIPVSRDYLASPPPASRPASAISARSSATAAMRPAEFLQAGIEIASAAPTRPRPTPKCWRSAWRRPRSYGLAAPDIRIGDVALFAALIAALDLAPAWKRRLVKDFNRKTNLAQDLDRLMLGGNNARPEYQGVLAALAGSDPKGAHALVTDLLSIAGINAVGGRSVGEIADRFLEQSALGASDQAAARVRGLIERFLAIAGDPDEAAAELRALAADAKLLPRSRRARSVRKPHRLPRRARHRPQARALLDRLRPRLRLLHRLRVRTDRSGAHRRSAGRRRPL